MLLDTMQPSASTGANLSAHPNRPEALLSALQSATVGGRESSRLVHLASTWAKVRKKLPGARTE